MGELQEFDLLMGERIHIYCQPLPPHTCLPVYIYPTKRTVYCAYL